MMRMIFLLTTIQFSLPTVCSRTQLFTIERNVSIDKFIPTIAVVVCKSKIQCAVYCMNIENCKSIDALRGNVFSQNGMSEKGSVVETLIVSVAGKEADDLKKQAGYLYMVPVTGKKGKKREILRTSLTGGKTYKTGITISGKVYKMIFIKEDNILVLGEYKLLFKGEMNKEIPKVTKITGSWGTHIVHHHGVLYWCHGTARYIQKMSLTHTKSKIWHSSGNSDMKMYRIAGLAIIKDTICFIFTSYSGKTSLRCADVPSEKATIRSSTDLKDAKSYHALAILDVDENRRLFAGTFRYGNLWISVFAKDNMKTALVYKKLKNMHINAVYFYNNMLFYSIRGTMKITAREIFFTNFSLGTSVTMEYPYEDGGKDDFLAVAFP